MTEQRIRELREKAAKARQFAKYSVGDSRLVSNLESYAKQLDDEVLKLESPENGTVTPEAAGATQEPPITEAMAGPKPEEPKEGK